MRLRKLIVPAVLVVSVGLNLTGLLMFGEYAKNHGGMLYVKERFHLGPPSVESHISPDNDRRALFKVVPKVPGQIVFLGDSLTQGGPWADMFPTLPICNRGIGGSTTLDGFNTVSDGALDGGPSKVFLQFGVNDLDHGASTAGFTAQYRKLIDKVKEVAPHARIYIQGAVPGRWMAGDTADGQAVKEANVGLAALAADEHCTFIDLYPLLDKDPEHGLPLDLTADGIHLTTKAYVIWIEAIRKYVTE